MSIWATQHSFRPCLVISIPATQQDRALATLIPHTTSLRGSRFEVEIKVNFLRAGPFDVQNIITIPHAKLLRKLGSLTHEQVADVEKALLFWLGCEEASFEDKEDEE